MSPRHFITAALLATYGLSAAAQSSDAPQDTFLIPERAVVLTGGKEIKFHNQVGILYSEEDLSFNDPRAPRFLFLDREGKVALGIGGYVKGVAMYDMDGAINSTGFTTYDIPVPMNPAQRNRFGADASHSTIFLKLAANSEKLGQITVYMQTSFTGDDGGYGLALKQAYVQVGNVTAGKARSTFADGATQAPTIDSEGPSGQIDKKNILFRYTTPSFKGFKAAASIEVPTATYSLGDGQNSQSIAQRFPDIPAYIQYGWDGGDSHVRLSGIYRRLSYRNLVESKNCWASGWGVHLSTISNIAAGFQFYGHIAYGKGITSYLNDLEGDGYDLIPTNTPGELRAPKSMGWAAGIIYNASDKLMMSAGYSQAHMYGTQILGPDSYKNAGYAVANVFYNLTPDFQIGAEYLHGIRRDINNLSGHANRLEVSMQYSF
ncbi:MAG: porin [Muribaculaceae bacterium]|nr:porin [Muribaculaceae bacterium]